MVSSTSSNNNTMICNPKKLECSNLKLIGRHSELQMLHSIRKKIDERVEMVMIQGTHPGVGKTALVRQFQKECNREIFCGTFVEHHAAIASLLRELTRGMMIVNNSDQDNSVWQARFAKELTTTDAWMLRTLVPEMDRLFETPTDCLFAAEEFANLRLSLAIRNFMRIVCRHVPVIFFLDDLQEADEELLEMMSMLTKDLPNHFMLICACEDTANNNKHVLELYHQNNNITTLRLDHLSSKHVTMLLAEIFQMKDSNSCLQEFSRMIYLQTAGNAFFILQVLQFLYQKGHLYYAQACQKWTWVMDRIDTCFIMRIVDMMTDRMRMMSRSTQRALSSAALLGAMEFDVATVFQVMIAASGRKGSAATEWLGVDNSLELDGLLRTVVQDGLLVFAGPAGKYRFAHDLVRQGAVSLLPPGENRKRMSLRVGWWLHRMSLETKQQNNEQSYMKLLFLAVHLLQNGADTFTPKQDKETIAALLLTAAQTAMSKYWAPALAMKYLENGLQLLGSNPETRWELHPEASLELCTMLAHVQLCNGMYYQCKHSIEQVLQHKTMLREKIGVYRTLLSCLKMTGKFDAAMKLTLFILQELGLGFPKKKRVASNVLKEVAKTKRMLTQYTDAELLELPDLVDSRILTGLEFVAWLGKIAHYAGQTEYQTLAVMRILQLSLEHGWNVWTSRSFAQCGVLFATMTGNSDVAHRLGSLALKAATDKRKSPQYDGPTVALVHHFLIHWKRPYRDSVKPLLKAFHKTLGNGDVDHLFYSIGSFIYTAIGSGLSLSHLEKEMQHFGQVLMDYGLVHQYCILQNYWQMVLNFMNHKGDPLKLIGPVMDERVHVEQWGGNQNALQAFHSCKMILACYFGDWNFANEMLQKLCSATCEGPSPWMASRCLYQGMIAFSLAKTTNGGNIHHGSQFHKYKKQGMEMMHQLEKFVQGGSVNCRHMMLLLRAESCALGQKDVKVQDAYEDAAQAATKLGFWHHAALANERAGNYFLYLGDVDVAALYLNRAVELYDNKWGAIAKAEQLKTKHATILLTNHKQQIVMSSQQQNQQQQDDSNGDDEPLLLNNNSPGNRDFQLIVHRDNSGRSLRDDNNNSGRSHRSVGLRDDLRDDNNNSGRSHRTTNSRSGHSRSGHNRRLAMERAPSVKQRPPTFGR